MVARLSPVNAYIGGAVWHKSGVVISAVDLIRGIGVYAGLKPVAVEGATGLWNTNYEGKAKAAIEAMKTMILCLFMWRRAMRLDMKAMWH